MPLIKSASKKAMGENISREMDAGKPQKQAIAIAYATRRRAMRNKMAGGGMVENEKLHPHAGMSHKGIAEAIRAKRMAEGGPADDMGLQDQEVDDDNFLSEFMPPEDFSHEVIEEEHEIEPRKGRIAAIMSGLHKNHYGK